MSEGDRLEDLRIKHIFSWLESQSTILTIMVFLEPKFKDAKEIPCKMYTMVDVCSVNKFEEHKKHLEEVITLLPAIYLLSISFLNLWSTQNYYI